MDRIEEELNRGEKNSFVTSRSGVQDSQLNSSETALNIIRDIAELI